MKEYNIKFFVDDKEPTTRMFTLRDSSTNRSRSLMKQFFLIKTDNTVEINYELFNKIQEDDDMLNKFMKNVLIGNHDDINWMDADYKVTDEIIKDFFESFSEKTNS
jgi:hypothetical protein